MADRHISPRVQMAVPKPMHAKIEMLRRSLEEQTGINGLQKIQALDRALDVAIEQICSGRDSNPGLRLERAK